MLQQENLKKQVCYLIGLVLIISAFQANVSAVDSVLTKIRTFEKLAEGVYTIRHPDAPDTFPQGNTTVIIGDREVLVVDSCYMPSSAREDIEQIRQWTNKPVRYLVNTHWHYDHTMGNGVYWQAFSPLTIIAHTETAKQSAGYNPGWFERFPARGEGAKKILADGKDASGKILTESDIRDYKELITGITPVQAEFAKLTDRNPTMTFDSELNIDLGNMKVEIKHLGRGNTAGDTIVYLPKEKILVAGDLIDHPVPYLFSGYPSEFVVTLKRMSLIDFQAIVPGHGAVLRSESARAYLAQVTDFIQTVVSKVSENQHRIGGGPRNLETVREAVKKDVDVNAWRQKFAGDDKDNQNFFDDAFTGLVTSAYAEIWGR